jgi:S-(hydroxymethyl)glutathione dehydrogenase/alcohol dehydrogenase
VNEKILEFTNKRGVDVCIEAIGGPTTIQSAIEAVADAGRCVIIGLSGKGVKAQFEIARLVRRQIRIIGSYGGKARQDIPVILRMIENKMIKITEHITNRYKLAETVQAFRDLQNRKIRGRAIIEMN